MFSKEVFLKKFIGEEYECISPLLKDYKLFAGGIPTYHELSKAHDSLSLRLSHDTEPDKELVLFRGPAGVQYETWDEKERKSVITGDYQCETDSDGKHHYKKMIQLLHNKGLAVYNSKDRNVYYYNPQTVEIIFGSDELSKFMINAVDKSRFEKVGIMPDTTLPLSKQTTEQELLETFMGLNSCYTKQLKLELFN